MHNYHTYACLFPLLDDEEVQRLAEDIREHGQRQPVILDEDGLVLDGRNRLLACTLAGVQPDWITFLGDDRAKLELVVSLNLSRRHLSESQRAMVAARLSEVRAALPADSSGDGRAANLPRGKSSRAAAARELAVSARSVQDAATVLREGSADQVSAVERGDVAVSAAARDIRANRSAASHEGVSPSHEGVSSSRLSREEALALKREIAARIHEYPAAVRCHVATAIAAACQRYLP